MIGIRGAGFGLYGYLPALEKVYLNGEKVALVQRYKDVFLKRTELQVFSNNIFWVADEKELYNICDTLIISLSPEQQNLAVQQALFNPGIQYMLLEKPLAVSPNDSENLLLLLKNARKKIRIGYTFQYTDWFSEINKRLVSEKIERITIDWSFKANHYINDLQNWKRYHSKGGGVIRFYGIHCIALASFMGYDQVQASNSAGYTDDDICLWSVTFKGTNLPTLEFHVNSNTSENHFVVQINIQKNPEKVAWEICQTDPFNKMPFVNFKKIDSRAGLLKCLIESLFDEDSSEESFYQQYFKCNQLWKNVESLNCNRVMQG